MKRILHVSKYYYPFAGGIEQTARDCVNALSGKYEQKVICFNDSYEDNNDYIDDVNVIRAGVSFNIASQALSKTYGNLLKKIVKDYNPNIVIFHYPNPFVAHYLLKYLPRTTKLIIYWHLDIVKQRVLKIFFVGQNKRLIKKADLIISTSPNYVDGSPYLSQVKNKCVIIPSCINEERLKISDDVIDRAEQIRAENVSKTICLAVGRHTEYKGFKYLIQAAHLLDDSFQVYITGKGEETENLRVEAGDDKKVHFLGLVDDLELKAYLIAMDIFCFPSITKNEAFGLALAESMYYGKPAITFNIPGSGVNYVSLKSKTGLEVPNRNVEKYAEAIKELASDPIKRQKMGMFAKQRVEDNFMYKRYKDNIIKTLESVMGKA